MPRSKKKKQRILEVMRDPYALIDDGLCPIDKKDFRYVCPHTREDVRDYNDKWLLKQL